MSKTPKKTRRLGQGVLALIAGLFLASSVVRVSQSAGAASSESQNFEEMSGPVSTLVDKSGPPCTDADHIRTLLTDLQAREAAIQVEEMALADRRQALVVAETHINANLDALINAEAELAATMNLARSASENDLARLTTVYENMKPKEAVALFEEMDPEFSAGFPARMRADAAASIMAGLKPETAYSISVILAGRNALVPTE